ncbi:MAG: competence/damage-inducible protein A, partial [Planctomycetota bacterium]
MKAEILSTGNEVLYGTITDTNAAYISSKLREWGLQVKRHTTLGDDLQDLVSFFQEASLRSEVVISTGGLGPTSDDLTASAVSKALGVELVFHEKAKESMEEFFRERGKKPREEDYKQAYLPKGAQVLPNHKGTAPGFSVYIGNCQFFFLPGVPLEMKEMLEKEVFFFLKKRGEELGKPLDPQEIKTISVFGLREVEVSTLLKDIEKEFQDIRLGYRARFPIIEVKIYSQKEQKRQVHVCEKRILTILENWLVSKEGKSYPEVVSELLMKKNATLAVAESCTGGLLAHQLTNIPGISQVFLFGGVTYSNEAKKKFLSVSSKSLETYGAVSIEVAKEMAQGARKKSGATYGLATTGIAGPSGGTKEKPVGTICIGFASEEEVEGWRTVISFGDRQKNKEFFATLALDFLARILQGRPLLQ